MRHYTWNGSGGTEKVEGKEVIPNAGNGADIPIGTGMQPNDYDHAFNLNANYDSTTFGGSQQRVGLSNSADTRAREREKKEGRIASLMPNTGKG
jgi:hypothetical protein